MLWRIFLFLLTVPIAWSFGPQIVAAFIALVPGLALWTIGLLSSAQGLTFYFLFALALVLLWLSVRVFVFAMGFALPQAQRYSATKPARRLQGLVAELVVLGVIIAVLAQGGVMLGLTDTMGIDEIARTIEPDVRERVLGPLRESLAREEKLWAFDPETEMPPNPSGYPGPPPGNATVPGLFGPSALGAYGSPGVQPILPVIPGSGGAAPRLPVARPPDPPPVVQARQTLQAAEREFEGGADSPRVREAALEVAGKRAWLEKFVLLVGENRAGLFALALPIYALFVMKGRKRAALLYGRIFRFIEAGRFGFGGSARFAALVEEWGVWWRRGEPSLFMGRSLYSRFLHIGLKDPRHMLTIAGSRAGKGTTAIIPNLLSWPGSCIVIDPKGTNAAVTAQRRRDMGHDVYVVDPFQVVIGHLGMERSDAFNVFDALDLNSPTIREDIGVIADALVIGEPRAPMQKHWDDGARTVIAGLLTHLLTSETYKGATLPDIRKLLNQLPEKQAELWAEMFQNPAAGGRARDAAGRIINGAGTDEIRNIISNANKNTEFLSSVPVTECLSRSTFSFKQLRQKPTTIYLVLPLNVLKDHNRFLRMFINLTILEMATHGRSEIPVLMMMDEFLTLGHMTEVEKAFVYMAGYNLICWAFIQDYGQLEEIYGGSVQSFITNSRAVQVFGLSDPKSAGFVSEQIGKRSMRQVWGIDQMRSEWFREPGEVAKEIAINSEGETGPELQYILRSGRAAMLLEKVKYFEKPDFWGQVVRRSSPFDGLYGKDPDYGS